MTNHDWRNKARDDATRAATMTKNIWTSGYLGKLCFQNYSTARGLHVTIIWAICMFLVCNYLGKLCVTVFTDPLNVFLNRETLMIT